ncbi:hypothetical protein [Haloparvum sedimenti]|uniref:hypothetical protein n=1 Tax=Haloparvum sedimenti TaxID=1678448 RepID=UPI00071E9955|nr:hypothetical protein [Haloparvum sedimenti]
MSTDAPAFDCLACGTRASTDRIDYDALGYAVCPVCSRSTAPASAPMWTPSSGERDAELPAADGAFEWGDTR